ncbi:hypothetical protein PGTUg99_002707 [Puccinia graminis f. sp. tritici]|uniref:Uncharacterized protein n=1 Tax=Puccinia graminis f. sp. tritici TaxID=56615 RepID=A0A5B0NCH7_PUCGR|nr:hypothetical protein PGTUg99_002707 [Puccinia graminis f. sp. tritici]
MVDVNTTRATSKKIKDSASSKNRSEESSIAEALVPKNSAITDSDFQANLGTGIGKAPSGSSGIQIDVAPELRPDGTGKDRAPVAFLKSTIRAKTGVNPASQVEEEEEEEDNSPG